MVTPRKARYQMARWQYVGALVVSCVSNYELFGFKVLE